MSHERWHVTGDTWHMVWVEHSLKMSAPFGSPDHAHNRCLHISCVCLCQIYHSFYKDSPFYVALNFTWKVMLSHTLHTGCVICQQLFFGCVSTVLTFEKFFFPSWSLLILNHLDRESLLIGVHQQCNHFVHPVDLLLHSSVMLYSFVSSSFDTTLVKIELRSLRLWLFNHFRWYICKFSLTTLIWFFAWINILVIWLQNRPFKLFHSTSQRPSWWSSWEGDFFFL